uniref:Uncharacterized protein n=1 Tax=Rhizophora mucronata TaxID=61149 RepID=A0A2P2Q5M4_RHIMU
MQAPKHVTSFSTLDPLVLLNSCASHARPCLLTSSFCINPTRALIFVNHGSSPISYIGRRSCDGIFTQKWAKRGGVRS